MQLPHLSVFSLIKRVFRDAHIKVKHNVTAEVPKAEVKQNAQERTTHIMLDKPCIFLNSKNKCDIYEVRPLVCRKFGTVLDSEQEYSFACKYAEYYHNIDYSKTFNYHKSNGILFVENYFRIPKPIFYWVLEILPLIRSTNYEAVTKMCELNYETYIKSHF